MHRWCFLFTRNTLPLMVIAPEQLPHMRADELRDVVQSLLKTVTFKQATIDKLTHENAYLKRLKFAAQSERFSAGEAALLDLARLENRYGTRAHFTHLWLACRVFLERVKLVFQNQKFDMMLNSIPERMHNLSGV